MRAMMGFFRVDPFASYDTESASDAFPSSRQPKRRKRSSTYALMTDPEASSREEPLMLTFQLEVSDELGGGGGGGPQEASPEPDPCQWPGVLDSPEPLALSGAAAAITHAGSAGQADHVFPTTDLDTYSHALDIHPSNSLATPSSSSSYRLHSVGSRFADTNSAFYTTASQQPLSSTLFDPYSAVSRSSNSTPDSTDSFSLSFFPNWAPRPTSATHVDAMAATTTTTRPSPRAPTKMHVCWLCQKEFPRPSGLMTHMNTHSGLKRTFDLM